MPVKRTRKPPASVKYLLSGDRKLQRLSLKKIADSARKAKPKARSPRVKQAPDEEVASTTPKRIGGRLAVGGVVCLFAAAALLAAHQSAARPDVSADAPAEAATSSQQPSLLADRGSSTTPASTAARSLAAPAAIEKAPAPGPVKKTPPARAASSTAAPEPTAPVTSSPTLTVEGCLESDGSTYTLKDTSGLGAPKVRSWRTGFLKKRPSSIGVVDTTGRLRLQDRIGTRVAVTGSLADRELRATALRPVAASCR